MINFLLQTRIQTLKLIYKKFTVGFFVVYHYYYRLTIIKNLYFKFLILNLYSGKIFFKWNRKGWDGMTNIETSYFDHGSHLYSHVNSPDKFSL